MEPGAEGLSAEEGELGKVAGVSSLLSLVISGSRLVAGGECRPCIGHGGVVLLFRSVTGTTDSS